MRFTAALLALAVSLVAGCDDGRYDSAPGGAKYKPAFGARMTDGQLRIWTGATCVGVTDLRLYFEPSDNKLVLTSADERGADVDHLTVGGPNPAGLTVSTPLPADFDWRTAKEVRISVDGRNAQWGTTTELAEVIDNSADHPEDTYWFDGVGWLNPAQVAEQDGKTFLSTCTPNPE